MKRKRKRTKIGGGNEEEEEECQPDDFLCLRPLAAQALRISGQEEER